MSKKHSRGDGDEHWEQRGKRAKLDKNGNGAANGGLDAPKEKKPKREEKYKRQKKLREEKRDMRLKKEKEEQEVQRRWAEKKGAMATREEPSEAVSEAAPEAAPKPVAESTPQAPIEFESNEEEVEVRKDKKQKKEQKEKKEKKEKKKNKKDKKSKRAEPVEEPTRESPAERNGVANGDVKMEDTRAEPLPITNGTTQRNGAAYSYLQTAALDAVSDAEIQAFLQEKEINISDPSSSNLRPILQFAHFPSSQLLSKKPFVSFTNPTPIQSASWPFALSGRDVIGIAETGSGKTLAFSVPCVESLASVPKPQRSKKDSSAYARAVIVSPTRELAMQTHSAISTLASLVGLSAVCLYGGASKDEQRALLRKNSGADIIVATPGRLKDFLSEGAVSLSDVMFAVLDEADRMLDKGFEEDIKQILGGCLPREKRQTLMFTATWPTSVRGLAESFMVDPVKITIGSRTRAGGDEDGSGDGPVELQANSRIEQKVEVVDPRGKEQRLLELLREAQKGSNKNDRVLVFCLYKKEAVRVEQFLERRGIRVASIHGDLRQDQRTRSLEAFKAGTTSVLVATDVAARGLDIPEVKLVINVTVSANLMSNAKKECTLTSLVFSSL